MFIDYAQDLSCIGEILIFSENDSPMELNYEKVKLYKVLSFNRKYAVEQAQYTKVCFLDDKSVLDRYAFHMASGELENSDVQLIGIDESCADRTANSFQKAYNKNPLFDRALFMKKDLFLDRDEFSIENLFDTYRQGAFTLKGPKIFIYD
jgi:hypothetical protein